MYRFSCGIFYKDAGILLTDIALGYISALSGSGALLEGTMLVIRTCDFSSIISLVLFRTVF